MIALLESYLGKMKVTYSKVHGFLRMKIMYKDNSRFTINMKPYLVETVEEFGEILLKAETPAKADLFIINNDKPLVDDKRRCLFHRLVYHLIYCAIRGQRDLPTALSFLSKHLKFCNEGDYCKLWRLVYYIYVTINLEAEIGINDTGKLITFVDASFGVHSNIQSYMCSATTFGIRVFVSDSKMQKLNITSSTDAEIIATSGYILKVIFTFQKISSRKAV